MEPAVLEIGLTTGEIDGHCVRIYDKDRVICDCLRYRNKMDKEIFNKAIQGYISDTSKSIPRLMEYAAPLRVKKIAKDLISVAVMANQLGDKYRKMIPLKMVYIPIPEEE